ncbi:ejaculatory bulb-specific protein 3-like [Linepithema humile]|uniref:ejaculatory bulb-specific protein 3-like n=1 Tax=Linepithema humile TaxID=83485 RepID=UPI0006234CD8|nr:PREDICTED: ejaculatory bulb-specific protein 3-like [Linepithema humile]
MDYYKKDHKRMRLTLVLLLSFLASGLATGMESYPDTYENVNLDVILNNERLFNQYMDCVLDKAPCTADGHYLKHILPEAVATTCEKCNVKQRQMARKIGNYLKNSKPKTWAAFLEKYDPNKKYIATFEQFLVQIEK